MSTDAIGAVVFDWGGVILRICRSWDEGCDRAGVARRERPGGEAMTLERRRLNGLYQTGMIDCDTYFDGVAATTMGAYSASDVRRVHDAWLVEEYDGVRALIEELNGSGRVQTGLLSNTSHRHWLRHIPTGSGMADFPTIGLLRHKHASHLLKLAKPSVEIHRAFERESGLLPSQILFFDDLAENISGARAAGWHGVQIDHTGDTASQMRATLRSLGILDDR
ncbi:MAG: HAD-IA family hydrolase [Phycisphaeraceae bacterium]|nr:HAD-IA family hydrolase [Phycisphaeraceae bacterium]